MRDQQFNPNSKIVEIVSSAKVHSAHRGSFHRW